MISQDRPLTIQSKTMETSDEELIKDFYRSPTAFRAIYHKYLNPIYRYLNLKVGNVAEAEDLTSQVFLAALEGLPRYQDRGHFAAWLFSLARRKAADYYRQNARFTDLDEETPSPVAAEADPLGQVIEDEDLQNLRRLVARLPEEERELLRLRFAARLSFDEMATVLNRKTSAAKMALYRLLERLEIQMETHHA
jgi:RNA polymerase sigma factor (sigma-70 family)